MATLTKNKVRTYENGHTEIRNDLAVIAADIIYEGAAVGDNGVGAQRPLVAGDPFSGFAVKRVDNSAGAASAKRVDVKEYGEIVIPVTGVTSIADQGEIVYASDDDTFTLSSTGNSSIGRITRWVSGTTCVVHFEGVQQRSI